MVTLSEGQIRGPELPGGLTPGLPAPRRLDCNHVDAVMRVAGTSFSSVWGPQDYAYFLAHDCGVCLGVFLPDARGRDRLAAYFLGLLVQGDLDVISVATAPEFRRRGLGERLLAAAVATPGVKRTLLEVAVDNAAALCLYEKMDFRVIGRRPAYYDQVRDALVLVREGQGASR